MKKNPILLLLVSFISIQAFSKKEEFLFNDEFKKRKLYVVEMSENSEHVQSLIKDGKTAELNEYRGILAITNDLSVQMFKENWTETPVDAISPEAFNKLTDSEKATCAFVMRTTGGESDINFAYFNVKLLEYIPGKKETYTTEWHTKSFKVSFESAILSPADLLFVIKKMKRHLGFENQFNQETLSSTLASKTLLFDKESCDLTDEEIKENYDYPYKFVTGPELMELKNGREPGYVYLKVDFYEMRNFLIVDCETGQILSRSTNSGLEKFTMNEAQGYSYEKYDNRTQTNQRVYVHKTGVGKEYFTIYRPQMKIKKPILRVLCNQKQQIKYYSYLVPR